MQEVFLPTLVHTNLIKMNISHLLHFTDMSGDVGDLRNDMSEETFLWIICQYNDMINTVNWIVHNMHSSLAICL